jgi:hypothetical protein
MFAAKKNLFGSAPPALKWNRKSEAARFLKEGLESGELDPSVPPKQLYDTYPIFQQYELGKFRAALNKMKSDMGMHARRINQDYNSQGDDEDEDEKKEIYKMVTNSTGEVIFGFNPVPWCPIHLFYNWCDLQLRERISVVVVMPSGVNDRHSIAVKKGGSQLEIQVDWPKMFTDYEALHEPLEIMLEKNRRSKEGETEKHDHNVRIQEFKKHMKNLESMMENRMESKVLITLPKPVHAHQIESNPIGRRDGTRILYIHLVCECTDSGRQRGGAFFVV